jgi:hypothetical protein
MRQATHAGVGKESKKEERAGITLEDEKIMLEKGSLGCLTAKCLLDNNHIYNGFISISVSDPTNTVT